MDNLQDASAAVAELLAALSGQRVSPCTSLALGNLALVSANTSDPFIAIARKRATERNETALQHALEMAMSE